jgi:hypothetical protein
MFLPIVNLSGCHTVFCSDQDRTSLLNDGTSAGTNATESHADCRQQVTLTTLGSSCYANVAQTLRRAKSAWWFRDNWAQQVLTATLLDSGPSNTTESGVSLDNSTMHADLLIARGTQLRTCWRSSVALALMGEQQQQAAEIMRQAMPAAVLLCRRRARAILHNVALHPWRL